MVHVLSAHLMASEGNHNDPPIMTSMGLMGVGTATKLPRITNDAPHQTNSSIPNNSLSQQFLQARVRSRRQDNVV